MAKLRLALFANKRYSDAVTFVLVSLLKVWYRKSEDLSKGGSNGRASAPGYWSRMDSVYLRAGSYFANT